MKKWKSVEPFSDKLSEKLSGYSDLTKGLLSRAGIEDKESAEKFLNPDYERDTHDPYLSKDMKKAVGRVLKAIDENEKIAVFGDYDADGIPGTAILNSFFEKIEYKNFNSYIPDRYEEPYGLSVEAVETFYQQGASLIITVDCGITDIPAVNKANEYGIDVIVTDHHLPHEKLPEAFAIVNHKQEDDEYPYKYLCGAATAWKLVQAILLKRDFDLPKGWEKWLLDLVAISTVCDMVALTGENRVLVKYGLQVLRKTPRVGLQSLFKKGGVKQNFIAEDDIGFVIGPRINIASRMSHGSDAFKMLTTEDALVANTLADHLEGLNAQRKETVQVILDSVEETIDTDKPVIARGDSGWRIGVLGLTANRLAEKYEKTVCLWAENHQGEIKGSIRSDGTVHVLDLFNEMGGDEFFLDFGGHIASGGFSLDKSKLPEFEEKMLEAYKKVGGKESDYGTVFIQDKLKLSEVNNSLFNEIDKFAPFGMENPKPNFLFEKVEVEDVREFGKNGNTHLELSFAGSNMKAISFFNTISSFEGLELKTGKTINMVATLERSYWRGRPELRLRVIDIQPS